MATPANAAVRERRRLSTPMDIEQMNVMKALAAAEYSRRQFVLNFAASKNTQLLVPGQKADAIKGAEEWVVSWLNQNGYGTITNELFKYTVDARLWTTMVGDDVEFPFAFMRRDRESLTATTATFNNMNNNTNGHALEAQRPKSELFAAGYEIEARHIDQALAQNNISQSQPEAQRPKKQHQQSQSTDQAPQRQRSSKKQQAAAAQPPVKKERRFSMYSFDDLKMAKKQQAAAAQPPVKKERRFSVYSFDDLKMAKKLNQEKFPLLMRWSRSLSQRMSG